VQAFGGPKLSAAAIPALDKVILALPKNRRDEVDRPQIYAPRFNAHRAIDNLLDTMRGAIDSHGILSLTYKNERGDETKRLIRPLALTFWGSVWTLGAWCELRNNFRNFRLDRVSVCELTGASFGEEAGKTLADYLRFVGAE
jgi:predicted DNA-binding transcriptional regulator YafY